MKPARLAIDLGLALGLVLFVGGTFFLLDHTGLLGSSFLAGWWPCGLAVLGAAQVLFGDNRVARATGSGLILLGGVLMLADLEPAEWLDAGSYAWRAALASIGIALVVRACTHAAPPRAVPLPLASDEDPAIRPGTNPAERVQLFSVLSSQERVVSSQAFEGGQLSSILGGYRLDLRGANLPAGGEAVLELYSLMGEGHVLVPEDWTVVSDVVPILAEVRVKARPRRADPAKRLRIQGFALMSDIEVRN